jgi:hypothetical protein
MDFSNENRTEKNNISISIDELSEPQNVLDDEIIELNPELSLKTENDEFYIGNTADINDKTILVPDQFIKEEIQSDEEIFFIHSAPELKIEKTDDMYRRDINVGMYYLVGSNVPKSLPRFSFIRTI